MSIDIRSSRLEEISSSIRSFVGGKRHPAHFGVGGNGRVGGGPGQGGKHTAAGIAGVRSGRSVVGGGYSGRMVSCLLVVAVRHDSVVYA